MLPLWCGASAGIVVLLCDCLCRLNNIVQTNGVCGSRKGKAAVKQHSRVHNQSWLGNFMCRDCITAKLDTLTLKYDDIFVRIMRHMFGGTTADRVILDVFIIAGLIHLERGDIWTWQLMFNRGTLWHFRTKPRIKKRWRAWCTLSQDETSHLYLQLVSENAPVPLWLHGNLAK